MAKNIPPAIIDPDKTKTPEQVADEIARLKADAEALRLEAQDPDLLDSESKIKQAQAIELKLAGLEGKQPAPVKVEGQAKPVQRVERSFDNLKKMPVDRFRLSVELAKRNIGHRLDNPQIVEHQHRHFFDTINRKGHKNQHVAFMSGHTHEISYEVDAKGEPDLNTVKCGQALKEAKKVLGNGKVHSEFQPVDFGVDPNSTTGAHLKDDHTHKIEYVRSEHVAVKTK